MDLTVSVLKTQVGLPSISYLLTRIGTFLLLQRDGAELVEAGPRRSPLGLLADRPEIEEQLPVEHEPEPAGQTRSLGLLLVLGNPVERQVVAASS
jgi:hypothetical protein